MLHHVNALINIQIYFTPRLTVQINCCKPPINVQCLHNNRGSAVINNRNRLFEILPTDVHQLIFRHLTKEDLIAVRRSCHGGKTQVDTYLNRLTASNKTLLGLLSRLSRADIAEYLRRNFADKTPRFKALKQAALTKDACPFAYAVYAFVGNVTTLKANKLLACIKHLHADSCPDRIINTLVLIHFYLTQTQTINGKELSGMLRAAGDAYINLRGATIINTFYGINLSYADLRETQLFATLQVLSMKGADVSHATFDARTVLTAVDTTDMIVDGLVLADNFNVEYAYADRNQLRNPELAPVVEARQKRRDRRLYNPCSIM